MKTPLSHSLLTVLAGMLVFLSSGCQRANAAQSTASTALPALEDDLTWWTPELGHSCQVQYEGEIDLSLDDDF